MNNFADARSAKVSKFSSSAPADGGNPNIRGERLGGEMKPRLHVEHVTP
ncbi:MAG: hypothetical protein WCQ16_01260 [Verrucomicrobiae bacterium]